MKSSNPIIREFQRLERRGRRIIKVSPFSTPELSPHVEIHLEEGGPPYPVSVGDFADRDRLLSEFAAHLGRRGQVMAGGGVFLGTLPVEIAA